MPERAVTIDAAWQCHLDDPIGSSKEGKQADLVILEEDPLEGNAGNPYRLRDIPVMETWVSGHRVYAASGSATQSTVTLRHEAPSMRAFPSHRGHATVEQVRLPPPRGAARRSLVSETGDPRSPSTETAILVKHVRD
ncbi:amidohydrolase family protein [Burkholderia alba]|uniref:amidohydrolase family protein n=1 Tax=Burkholderia alba TaxID=2683677 RepID=UPI002B054542|nr:amidohydrolase family protein [Burkholderia alba]